MSLKDQKSLDSKNKTKVPTSDEIWQILKEVAQNQKDFERLSRQSAIEFKEEMKKRQEEAEKRQEEAERRAERRRKEAEKRAEKWQAEAEKRAERRQEEAEKRAERRRKEAEKRAEKWQEEAEKRQKEAEKRQEEAEKRQEEVERFFAQRAIEFKEEMKAHRKENDRQLNKFRGIWSNAWGDFVESLVSGRFVELIQHWIPSINQIAKNIAAKRGQHECEIDIIAINSDSLVATEVKSTLNVTDVREFLEKLKHFTLFFPQYKEYKIYGAVAYLKANQDAQKFAMRQGLFVICATGDSSQIINDKESFMPQVIQQAKQFLSK